MDNSKPFLTIDGQIELLEKRGVEVDSQTGDILLREGYYSVVNGYKDPFIDPVATKEAGDDRYKPGTRFSDIYALFLFDRELREVAFHYLLRIEALLKTVCTYTFTEHHENHDAYLKQESYATEQEYLDFGLSDYLDNMHKLHKAFHTAIEYPRNESVAHYKKRVGKIPLWVILNTMTFGNAEHFYNLMKPKEKNLVCKRIAEMPHFADYGYLDPKKMRRSIDILVKYRNKCAHDERLYCATVDKRNPVDFLGCIQHSSTFLSGEEAFEFVEKTVNLVSSYSDRNGSWAHIFDKTGLSRVSQSAIGELLSGGC